MSSSIVIIGASGFGKEVAWLAKRLDIDIVGFLDDNELLKDGSFYNYPVLGKIDEWVNYSNFHFTLAIASPKVRKSIVNKMFLTGSPKFKSLIDPSAIVNLKDVGMGEGCIICAGSICTADIKIGDFTIINKQCSIGHDVTISDFCTLSPKVMLGGHVHLFNGVEVGASSSIIQQLTVGEGAVIGMGSVVVKNVGPNSLYLGVPAKKIKNTDLL